MIEGIILKGIGGFYYVDTAEGLIECKAQRTVPQDRGQAYRRGPCDAGNSAGGRHRLSADDRAAHRNSLIRPAVANLDLVVAVASAAPPVTDPFLIDKVTAIAVHKNMDALVVINRRTRIRVDELYETYRRSGIEVLRVSAHTGEGIDALRERIRGRVSAFCGQLGCRQVVRAQPAGQLVRR